MTEQEEGKRKRAASRKLQFKIFLDKITPVLLTKASRKKLIQEAFKDAEWKVAQISNEWQQRMSGLTGNMPRTGKGIYGGDGHFATMSQRYDAIHTQAYLKSDNTLIAKASRDLVESQIDPDIKKDPEKHKELIESQEHKDLCESARRTFSGFAGIFGAFATSQFDFNDAQILTIQRQSHIRYHADPLAKSIINNLVSYVIGRGIKFSTPSEEINEFLNTVWWKNNDMESYHKERFLLLLINGEWLNRYKKHKSEIDNDDAFDGFRINIFHIPPDELVDIEIRENKFPLAYNREFIDDKGKTQSKWYADLRLSEYVQGRGLEKSVIFGDGNDMTTDDETATRFDGDKVEDEVVHHMKLSIGRRGKPFLISVLRYLQYYEDFVKDTARLWHEQARVIMVEYSADRTAKAELAEESPAGGLILKGKKGFLEWEFKSPQINATGANVMGRIIRLSIAAGTQTPEVIAFMDASNAVYASIKTTENPYSNSVLEFQDKYQEMLEVEVRFFIDLAIKNEKIPEEIDIEVFGEDGISAAANVLHDALMKADSGKKIDLGNVYDRVKEARGKPKTQTLKTRDIQINWVFPEAVKEDIGKLTEALQKQQDMGVLSKKTAAGKLGLAFEAEIENMLRERETDFLAREQERTRLTQGDVT